MYSLIQSFAWLLAVNHALASPLRSRTASATSTHQSGGEEYVVLLAKNPLVRRDHQTVDVLSQLDLTPDHPDVHEVYDNNIFHGFVANMKSHCLDLLHNMSDVTHVEKNMMLYTTMLSADDTVESLPLQLAARDVSTRNDTTWGLQRISSGRSLQGEDPGLMQYLYTTDNAVNEGNVDVYIVDTGIYTQHHVFGGRARVGWAYDNGDAEDRYGHGTHCAGTATGALLGVSDSANVVSIKALQDNGGGSVSDVLKGIAAAVTMHQTRLQDANFVGSVMSMSFGITGDSPAMSSIIASASAEKMHIALAAGNNAIDACGFTPASTGGVNSDSVVTVGSVGINGARSSFSNFGQCVDVYAPGESVLSAWYTGPDDGKYLDGTSMATPHVAGVMAYLMAADPSLGRDPKALKTKLLGVSLSGQISDDSSLRLLNNGWI